MNTNFIIAIVLLIVESGFAIPVVHEHVLKERDAETSNLDNPFDTGSIETCIIPTAQQLPICSKYIDYPVPEALLNETVVGIREKAVSGAKKNAEDRESTAGNPAMATGCGKTVEELECYKKFPSCEDEGSKVKFVNADTCKNKLQESCSEHEVLKSSCNTPSESLSLKTCNKVTSTPYQYDYCSNLQGWSDTYLTEWMNVSVINAEKDVASFAMFGTAMQCVNLYAQLKCGEAGRCWSQGTRMEINSTKELCESVLNCVSNQLKKTLQKQLDCSSYPSEEEKLSTPATDITDEPTDPVPPNTPSPPQSSPDTTDPTTRPTTGEIAQTEDDGPPSVDFPYSDPGSSASTLFTHSKLQLLLFGFAIVKILLL